jgi:hypothetical protein
MGKIFEFRSDLSGTGHVTSCVSAAASWLAAETGFNTAVVQLPGGKNDICDCFDRHLANDLKKEIYKKTGLSALLLMIRGGRLNEEKVRGCALKTLSPSLDVFHGGGLIRGKEEDELSEVMISEIGKVYDLVLVDCGAGRRIKADTTMWMLPQSKRAWKEHFEKQGKDKKDMFVVNGSLKNSTAGAGSFRFSYGTELTMLPSCTGFMDALSEGTVVEFFKTMRNMGRYMPDHYFTSKTGEMVNKMLKGGGR